MPQVISLFQGKSFQEQFPGIRVRYDMNCFVKMQCYSLAIPADTRSWKEIDIFSDTVLRLIALDRDLTTGQIAERMCVGKDFVQFIFIRLREAGLIDDRNKLTERGRHQTQQSFAEQRADLDAEPLMAYAFALPGTQEYLSYLRVGELMAEQATENRDNGRCWIEFETGSAGREKTIRGQLLRIRENGRQPLRYSALPPVIRRYNRICAGNSRFQKIPYRNGYNVEAAEEGTVLLHCKAAIQDGNADSVLFSDGFSLHCFNLYEAACKADPGLTERLFKRASSVRTEQSDPDREKRLPPAQWRILKALNAQEIIGGDVDSAQEAEKQNSRTARELCTAVELALCEFVKQNPLPDWQKAYLPEMKTAQIIEWAKEIGLAQAEQYRGLFRWPGNRRAQQFLAFDQSSDPELTLGLCLTVMIEKSDGPTRFSRLIHKKKDLLKFLSVLKQAGESARHEGSSGKTPLSELRAGCREVISLLLPEVQLSEDQKVICVGNVSQARIDARVAVCEKIGWDVFEQLPSDLKGKLLQVSPDKDDAQLPPKDGMLLLCSQIMESALRNALKELPLGDVPEKQAVLKAIETQTGRALPEEFSRTSPGYLDNALRGKPAVLKAYYLAYLYRCCQNAAGTVPQAAQERWTALVEEIDRQRQHTASRGFLMRYEELKKYRDDVFGFVTMIVRSE